MSRDDFIHTNSSLNTYHSCPRKWKHKYLDLYRESAKSSPLMTGSAVHLGLEKFWTGNTLEDTLIIMEGFFTDE
jgi:hypothetical protein